MVITKETSITRGKPCALREPTVVLVGMSVGFRGGTECEAAGRVEAVAVEVVGSEDSGCLLDWAGLGLWKGDRGRRLRRVLGFTRFLTDFLMVQGR